jgi:hypothetical protein
VPLGNWRKPESVGLDEYLHFAAEEKSYKSLARRLDLNPSSMDDDLKRRGVYAHVGALLTGRSNPGPKRPPTPLIEGAGPDSKPDIEEIKRHARERYRLKAARSEQKDDQHIRFSHGPVAIFFIGDQHFGNAGTDVERAYAEQELILSTPGAYVWQMGDVIDNFIVGKLMVENFKSGAAIMEQWWLAENYLQNFGDRLLAFCAGNHGMWTLKMVGIDYNKNITPSGVLYDGDEIKASVHVGDKEFRVWSRHKWRGNSMYNPTHGMERACRFDSPNYDAFVGAHVHRGAMAREFVHDRRRKVAMLSGAYKIHDDFATSVGFEDHDASTAVALVLHEDGSYFACADIRAVSNYMHALYPAKPTAA